MKAPNETIKPDAVNRSLAPAIISFCQHLTAKYFEKNPNAGVPKEYASKVKTFPIALKSNAAQRNAYFEMVQSTKDEKDLLLSLGRIHRLLGIYDESHVLECLPFESEGDYADALFRLSETGEKTIELSFPGSEFRAEFPADSALKFASRMLASAANLTHDVKPAAPLTLKEPKGFGEWAALSLWDDAREVHHYVNLTSLPFKEINELTGHLAWQVVPLLLEWGDLELARADAYHMGLAFAKKAGVSDAEIEKITLQLESIAPNSDAAHFLNNELYWVGTMGFKGDMDKKFYEIASAFAKRVYALADAKVKALRAEATTALGIVPDSSFRQCMAAVGYAGEYKAQRGETVFSTFGAVRKLGWMLSALETFYHDGRDYYDVRAPKGFGQRIYHKNDD